MAVRQLVVHGRRYGPGLIALLAVAMTAWALVARWHPAALLEVGPYRDDAYYYFAFVRSWCEGNGPSCGAGIPTNGLQIGWALLLCPLYLWGGPDTLVEGARVLGVLLHLATAAVLCLEGRRLGLSGAVSLAAAATFVASAPVLDEAQNGQETALAAFALAVLVRLRGARWLVFAGWSVVVMACRSDLGLFVLALSLWRTGTWTQRLGVPALCVVAFASWNALLSGSPWPDQARPVAWLAQRAFVAADPTTWEWLHRIWWLSRPCIFGIPFVQFAAFGTAALLALALRRWVTPSLAVFAIVSMLISRALGVDDLEVLLLGGLLVAMVPPVDRRTAVLAFRLLAAGVGLCVLHYLVRWYARPYYFVPLAVAGSAGLLLWLRASSVRTGGALAAVGFVAWGHREPLPDRPWQELYVVAGQYAGELLGSQDTLAAFNSGILSWHAGGGVVNLDGVAHREAFEAMRGGRTNDVLDRYEVDWIVDARVQFEEEVMRMHGTGFAFGDAPPQPPVLSFTVPRMVESGIWQDVVVRAPAGRARGVSPRIQGLRVLGPRPGGGCYLLWDASAGSQLFADASGEGAAGGMLFVGRGVPRVIATPHGERVTVWVDGVQTLTWSLSD